MEKCGIYQIWCNQTGKFYVGSSRKIYGRWTHYRYLLRKEKSPCVILQHAWTVVWREVLERKREYDRLNRAAATERKRLARQSETPEQHEKRLAAKRDSYHRCKVMIKEDVSCLSRRPLIH